MYVYVVWSYYDILHLVARLTALAAAASVIPNNKQLLISDFISISGLSLVYTSDFPGPGKFTEKRNVLGGPESIRNRKVHGNVAYSGNIPFLVHTFPGRCFVNAIGKCNHRYKCFQ